MTWQRYFCTYVSRCSCSPLLFDALNPVTGQFMPLTTVLSLILVLKNEIAHLPFLRPYLVLPFTSDLFYFIYFGFFSLVLGWEILRLTIGRCTRHFT